MTVSARAWRLETPEPEHTHEVGRLLGAQLDRGDLVALTGELGTGKTTLARGLVDGLQATGYFASPSFTLIREYHGRCPVYHVDLYRLDAADADDLGIELEEMREAGVMIVEWADRAPRLMRPPLLSVHLAFGPGDQTRLLAFTADGARPQAGLAALQRRHVTV